MSSRETERPVMNATRARQGRWGRHVFWVLVFGTLLAALGMFAAWTWKSADEGPPAPGRRPSTAEAMARHNLRRRTRNPRKRSERPNRKRAPL